MRDWLAGRTDVLHGLMLRSATASGVALVGSRKAANANDRPLLLLTYGNGEVIELPAAADTFLDCTTERGMGKSVLLKAGSEYAALMRFDVPAPRPGVELSKASLRLSLAKVYGKTTLGAFAASPPQSPDSVPREGIAHSYAYDVGLDKAPGVLFTSGFDGIGWQLHWSQLPLTSNADTVDADPAHGFAPLSGRALRVTIPRGRNLGLDLRYYFGRKAGYEPEEAYFRYYLRFANDWKPSDGGKLPGFAGTYGRAGWGMRSTSAADGWSLRGGFFVEPESDNAYAGTTAIGTYAYHADMQESSGETWSWPFGRIAALERNRWYCVEQYVKLNTPGERDGLLRAWVDGRLAFERANIRLRDTKDVRIETVWFNVYHGGTQPAPSDMHLYIDNVVVATRYIGPMSTGAR